MQSGGGEVVGGERKISQHAEIQHIFVFILQAIIYGHLHLLSVMGAGEGGVDGWLVFKPMLPAINNYGP